MTQAELYAEGLLNNHCEESGYLNHAISDVKHTIEALEDIEYSFESRTAYINKRSFYQQALEYLNHKL